MCGICLRASGRPPVQARRSLQPVMSAEGGKVRKARLRRRWSQTALARRVGVSQPTISAVERGDGSTLSVELWQQVALLLGLPLKFELGRDTLEEPRCRPGRRWPALSHPDRMREHLRRHRRFHQVLGSKDCRGRGARNLNRTGEPYSLRDCWVIRATRRNRELVARYPELFATRFPGSSRAWVAALAAGKRAPPTEDWSGAIQRPRVCSSGVPAGSQQA